MPSPAELERWSTVLASLLRGPAPRGDTFDLCRRVVATVPAGQECALAARTLLEGAMADATTSLGDAQEVMRLLRALDRSELAISDLLSR